MLEVVYRRSDGMIVRSLAFYSYRRGPIGQWMLGDKPLSEVDGEVLYQGTRLNTDDFDRMFAGWRKPTA